MNKDPEEKADIWKKFLTQCGARLTSQDVHWPMQLSMRVAPGPMTRASGFRQRSREKQHERWLKKAKRGTLRRQRPQRLRALCDGGLQRRRI